MYTAEQAYELALLMLCIWREAQNQSPLGQEAVAWVIRNRVDRGKYGKGWIGVILKPWQFSSFNANDPMAAKLPMPLTDIAYQSCLLAAKHVYDKTSADPTFGATHYFADSMAANPPSWAKDFVQTTKIGQHTFFREP